jgi:hypothetical protein
MNYPIIVTIGSLPSYAILGLTIRTLVLANLTLTKRCEEQSSMEVTQDD